MEQVLLTILDALKPVLITAITALVGYFITYINSKKKEVAAKTDNEVAIKYLDMIEDTVVSCVKAVSQTFVDTLKKDNAFTQEMQEQAFKMAYSQVLLLLSEDCKQYITEVFGDVQTYLTNKIEAAVADNK